MPLRPVRGVGIRTPRDEARRAERLALAEQWALIDLRIDDALEGTIPPDKRSHQ